MKKLAITSVAVLIALIGFIAILCFIPCKGDCCGERDRCEMRDGKCPHEKGGCEMGEGKCEGKHEGCEKGNGKCMVKEWTDADGKCHKEVKVTVGGDDHCGMSGMSGMGCPMENGDHSGCCGCCMMKNGGGHHEGGCCKMDGDSMKTDSMKVKVRGKL